MIKIVKITAREILDSRGWPTLQADVFLSDGSLGRASVPSGASKGAHEAVELRDRDKKRYGGNGVLKAVESVAKIEKILKGKSPFDPQGSDASVIRLDGTPDKSRLGANAMLAVSMAVLRAGASSLKKPLYRHIRDVFGLKEKGFVLPVPMLNIINGGKHSNNGLSVQEFMIVPSNSPSFREAIRTSSEIYHSLKNLLAAKGMVTSLGDEGGFAPKIAKHEEVLAVIQAAVNAARAKDVCFAIDAAASEFFANGKYYFEGKAQSAQKMVNIYAGWLRRYPIVSAEDPLSQDEWEDWRRFTEKFGKKINIVGDDLFATNPARLARGIKEKAANAVLVKLNQIGTVCETLSVVYLAKKSGYGTIISHRSGETEDSFIADFAVAVNAGAIKAGAPARGERLAKYNRLLQIEEELGKKAVYARGGIFKR
jgi:enolase